MSASLDRAWLGAGAEAITASFESELEALVAISSPSGDVDGAERMCAAVSEMLPSASEVERPPCSSPGFAPDLLATIRGTGERRLLLLGHLDTVVAHDEHRPLERTDGRLIGSGTVDMKGGDVFALGVMRALAARPGCVRRGRTAARRRRGVANRRLRPRPALRRLGRLPVLRGGPVRTRRRGGAGRQAQGGRHDPRSCPRRRRSRRLGSRRRPQRAARARRGRRPSRRGCRSRRRGPPDRGAHRDPLRRCVQRRPLSGRARLRRARRLARGHGACDRGGPGRDRRGPDRGRVGAPVAGDGHARARLGAPGRSSGRDCSALRSLPRSAAGPAMPATWPATWRLRSTASARTGATPITRTSTSTRPPCARGRRSHSRLRPRPWARPDR